RPCDSCRKRKSRCVTEGESSVCVLCKFHGQPCTYEEAPKPRKRNASRDGERSNAASPVKRSLAFKTIPGTGVEEYDTLPGPSLLKRTLGLQNLHHSQYIGRHEVPDPYGAPYAASSDGAKRAKKSDDLEIVVRPVHPSHAFRIIPDPTTEGYSEQRGWIDDIEAAVYPHGNHLVQLYFRIIHPSFPILHQQVFLEKYARSYREFSPPLLAAVYLAACGYWRYSEHLIDYERPDLTKLRHLAFASFRATVMRPKLSTVQAGLLLAQYEATDKHGWINGQQSKLAHQLVDLAYTLGLHLDARHWEIPDWEIGLRRRIGWAVYMQDKWTALLHGRPSLISAHDWCVPPLDEDDFPEIEEDDREGSAEVEKSRLVFMQMASLTEILSGVLVDVFSARSQQMLDAAVGDKIGLLLTWVKPWQLHLRNWFSSLPESLRMDTAASMKLSPVGYLRLAYLTLETCIHRHIIRTLAMSETVDPNLVRACRAAGKDRLINAVDFLQRLQAQHLASFWYYISSKCCALIHAFGQSLAASALDPAERAFYEQKVKEFRWTLKVNSEAGTGFMKQAIGMLDIS
ncbi:fungal-specific transcription factor domain-containing protein, partial [Neohortaea acidophila]